MIPNGPRSWTLSDLASTDQSYMEIRVFSSNERWLVVNPDDWDNTLPLLITG
jgi:hypothetical protein